MKQRVVLVDSINSKTIVNEVNIPNKVHLDAQIRFPHLVQKDKTKYTRKIKHKNKSDY